MQEWHNCRHILIIRPDNLGDLLMTSPAIRAVKNTFGCRVTLLTSEIAAGAAPLIPGIDEVIGVNFPWVKQDNAAAPEDFQALAAILKEKRFDAGILFTVYSQNPMPAIMLMWMAGIPRRLAYCRENPYELLNYWVPEKEPFTLIRHQVERDLKLVQSIGAVADGRDIRLEIPAATVAAMERKLRSEKICPRQPFFIFHAGVSEEKRQFPLKKWIALARSTIQEHGIPVLFTGSPSEQSLTDTLQKETGPGSFSLGKKLTVPEFAALIRSARLLVSVNTGAVHLAAGLQTPVLVLYAQTNPQHTPWGVPSAIFEYSIPARLQSRNEIIRYVHRLLYTEKKAIPDTRTLLHAITRLYKTGRETALFQEHS